MSVLVFDADHSLSSIGKQPDVTKLFGASPIRVTSGLHAVKLALDKVFIKTLAPLEDHPLFGKMDLQDYEFKLSPLAIQHNLQAVAIDTISHAFRQDMRLLESKRNTRTLEFEDWGALERMYNLSISDAKRYPIPVVWNCHVKLDKDQMGQFQFGPQLKGSTAAFINEYFDVVVFTKVLTQAGKRTYLWTTKPDASHPAKDRCDLLDDVMPQDFGIIIKRYADAGWPAPKIMVIGKSGEGKSRSLVTLANYFKP